MRRLPQAVLLCGFATILGCGNNDSAPIKPPSYDSDTMAKTALAELDKNANGTIEGPELDACPGLKGSLTLIDTNNDGKISLEELKTRFAGYSAAGAVGFNIRVSLDGNPLPDATVTLTPEPFMNAAIGVVTAKTNGDGVVNRYTVDGRDLPGLPSGVYRIAVTKDGTNIPDKFNSRTSLGCELSAGGRSKSSIELKLTSK